MDLPKFDFIRKKFENFNLKKRTMVYLIGILVLSTLLLTITIGNYAKGKINKIIVQQKDDILSQIKSDFNIFDKLLLNIEEKMIIDMKKSIILINNKLANSNRRNNISRQELKNLAALHGVNEIYLIDKQGKVFNTSFKPDINLDLFSYGESFSDFLKKIYGTGKVFNQRISLSYQTGVLNLYLYYSPPGSDYIVEISVKIQDYIKAEYSKEYYSLIFKELFFNSVRYNKYLKSCDVYIINESSGWSFINEGQRFNGAKEQVMQARSGQPVQIIEDNIVKLYFIPELTDSNFDFANDLYIELIYDLSILKNFVMRIVIFSVLLYVMIMVVIFLISNNLFNNFLIKRILGIKKGLADVEEGNYRTELEITGNDELASISNKINKMKHQIQLREKKIQDREAHNYALFEYNPIETIVVDKTGKILKFNLAVKLNRQKLPEIGSILYKDFAGKHEIDLYSKMLESIQTGVSKYFPEAVYDKQRIFRITISPFPKGAIITSEDISPQIEAKQRIANLNAVLKAIRNVNQLITKEKDILPLIKGAAVCLTETGIYNKTMIILFDDDYKVYSHAQSGFIDFDFPDFDLSDKKNQMICNKNVFNESETIIIEANDPSVENCQLLDLFAESGIYIFKLGYEDKIYGMISVSVPQNLIHDPENLNLFKEVADDLAFALYKIELETKHEYAVIKIKKSLKEKEILIQEIHHRVKNNMQVITSLLKLQSRFIKNEYDKELFKDSYNRVKSMSLVHEKLYGSKDLSNIDFGSYVIRLTELLMNSMNIRPTKIKINVEIEEIFLDINRAIPCGLIINELVSNSLKYAFPESMSGTITISIEIDESEYILIISDDGIGFPDNIKFNDTETLGMQLVVTLVEQIKGKIELDNSNGTFFRINFKKD